MKKIFIVFLCVIMAWGLSACSVVKKNIEDTNIVESVQANTDYIILNYYQKHQNKTFTFDMVKDKMYVKVASGLKTAYNVSFGMVNFNSKEKVKFNLGNNSFVYTVAFYLKKGELFVFTPLVALEGGTINTLLFCVDGLYFSTKVYDGNYKKVMIADFETAGGKTDITKETNVADRNVITQTISSKDDFLKIKLSTNNTVLNRSDVVFLRKSFQKYDEPTEYVVAVCDDDGYIKISYDDIFEEVKNEKTKYIDVHITCVKGGIIGFDLVLKSK